MNGYSSSTKKHGHVHGEAFMLMAYVCKGCGHRKIIWNSRDGVTPFGMDCPDCERATLNHVEWERDCYAPNHKLRRYQNFWRDGTPDEAESIMRRRIEMMRDKYPCTPEHETELIQHARTGGGGEFQPGWPMLDVWSQRARPTEEELLEIIQGDETSIEIARAVFALFPKVQP